MKIGIDISQLAHQKTGVANYLKNLVEEMAKLSPEHEYILFFSSLRGTIPPLKLSKNVTIKQFKIPPTILNILWNRLHIMPIEWFIGSVDVFMTSDWTEPPTRKAKKVTIMYDTTIYLFPAETAQKIQAVHKRKNYLVKKESDMVFTISQSSKNDIHSILDIPKDKISVIYPGLTL
jgi:glycosyltransferase involved in cell wall biosynthesis